MHACDALHAQCYTDLEVALPVPIAHNIVHNLLLICCRGVIHRLSYVCVGSENKIGTTPPCESYFFFVVRQMMRRIGLELPPTRLLFRDLVLLSAS
jgi:hypothetical protein